MKILREPYYRFRRYHTLATNRISVLPVLVLMPHSACNCRCVMCDIWKGNAHASRLSEKDVEALLHHLEKWGTSQVVMSGGEALLNPVFFRLCRMIRERGIRITLLSTGILLSRNALNILEQVNDLIVSLDGDEETHDAIRNVRGAYAALKQGVQDLKYMKPDFRIRSRTVIHRLNFRKWHQIIESAKDIGIDQVSFLPADISSHAFNREVLWAPEKQQEIAIMVDELEELKQVTVDLLRDRESDFTSGYIAESPEKIFNIYRYYNAWQGFEDFPFKKCNAPWVSAVIEADGQVRPCFFHEAIGNIHQQPLDEILNGERGINFRKNLDMAHNDTCRRCVCSLYLPPGRKPV